MSFRTPAKQVILGVGISKTSYTEVANLCVRWLVQSSQQNSAPARYICITSVHGIITGVFDPGFRSILNNADIATPDGMPVVWALRSFGAKNQTRVYGPTLMFHVCEIVAKSGHSIFLYGGKPEVLDRLRQNLECRFPDLKIAGAYSPPFRPLTPDERETVIRRILETKAHIIFVGLSTPKQENWMAACRSAFHGCILIGVGAAFDFHAHTLKQAPRWMQDAGLEWLFRFMIEPRRLWKRYLLITPLFLPLWGLQKLGLLRYPQPSVGLEKA